MSVNKRILKLLILCALPVSALCFSQLNWLYKVDLTKLEQKESIEQRVYADYKYEIHPVSKKLKGLLYSCFSQDKDLIKFQLTELMENLKSDPVSTYLVYRCLDESISQLILEESEEFELSEDTVVRMVSAELKIENK